MERRLIAKEVYEFLYPNMPTSHFYTLYMAYLVLKRHSIDVCSADYQCFLVSDTEAAWLKKERWLEVTVEPEWHYRGGKRVYTGNSEIDIFVGNKMERFCRVVDQRVNYYKLLQEMPCLFGDNKSKDMNIRKLEAILYKYTTSKKADDHHSMAMIGLFFHDGVVVACNSRTLFKVKTSYPKDYEGCVLSRGGTPVLDEGNPVKYPSYAGVIPATDDMVACGKTYVIDNLQTACSNLLHSGELYLELEGFYIMPSILDDALTVFDMLGEQFNLYSYADKEKQFYPVMLVSESCTVCIMPSIYIDAANMISFNDAVELGDLL